MAFFEQDRDQSYVVIATTSRTYGSIPDRDFFEQDMNQSLFGEILFENRDRDIHNGVPSSSVVVMSSTPAVLSYVVIATPARPYRSSLDMAFGFLRGRHGSKARKTLSVMWLLQLRRGPTEVVWTWLLAFFEEDMDQSIFGEILLENQDGDL